MSPWGASGSGWTIRDRASAVACSRYAAAQHKQRNVGYRRLSSNAGREPVSPCAKADGAPVRAETVGACTRRAADIAWAKEVLRGLEPTSRARASDEVNETAGPQRQGPRQGPDSSSGGECAAADAPTVRASLRVCTTKAAPMARPCRNRPGRTRTCNPRFWRPVLCQLSYGPLMAGRRSDGRAVACPHTVLPPYRLQGPLPDSTSTTTPSWRGTPKWRRPRTVPRL